MVKRYRYRLYPDDVQCAQLARTFGCARVVYNDVIAARKAAQVAGVKAPSVYDLMKAMARSKRTEERCWLGEVTDVALQQAMRDADTAYQNFFASLRGECNGRKVGAPRFKSRKDHRDSFRITGCANFSVQQVSGKRGRVRLPRIGWVDFAMSRRLPAAPSSLTVTQEPDGRYYVSFVVEAPGQPVPKAIHQTAGLDLGLNHLAVIAHEDGTVTRVENPRHLRKKLGRLARLQKDLSRKEKGSANREKARLKVAVAHRKVREARLDHHHNLARKVIDENQVIGLETLGITKLARTRLAKSIHDAGWGILMRLIEEKATEAGRTVVRADRAFPSTRMCSACGAVGERKPLNVRFWVCDCGATHDRDVNAAMNLRNVAAGQAETINDCGGLASPARVSAGTGEAVTTTVAA